MAPEFHERVRELFDEALERPEPERVAFVEAACAGDAGLLQAVERLLRAHQASESFLKTESRPAVRMGRYLIRGELGRGAMGVVYDAIDPMIGRSVAVKVIQVKALTSPGEAGFMRERLFREARSAGQLFHPGIVVIFDVGQDGDSAFIAMERVDGPSLQQILSSGLLDTREALRILRETAAALDYAHRHDIVHRDVKPSNIMLHSDSRVKMTDFGTAKIMSGQQSTIEGVVMGTPIYMSPEQIEARPVDGRSDQFSLAVLAYELLTGKRAFEADSMAGLAHLIVYGARPSARSANPALPSGLDEVFQRGLSRAPDARFASCVEFVAALQAPFPAESVTKGTTSTNPATVQRAERRAVSWLGYWGGLGVVVTLVLALLFYRNFASHAKAIGVKTGLPAPIPAAAAPPMMRQVPAPGAKERAPVSAEVKPKMVPALTRARQLYADAIAKRRVGRLQDAEALFRQAAELGDGSAMAELGESYRSGEGVPQDQSEALRWFHRAADAGSSSGMVALGAMYLLGDGIEASDEDAAQWFQKAAARKNAAGMYDLATMYESGRGVSKDPNKARQLYKESAELGNSEAVKRLAELDRHN